MILQAAHYRPPVRRYKVWVVVWGMLMLWGSRDAIGADSGDTAQAIMERAREHADDYITLSKAYTFLINFQVDDYHSNGQLKKRQLFLERLYHYYGRRFFRILSDDGEPLQGEALIKEDRRETKFRARTKAAVARGDSSGQDERKDNNFIYVGDLIDRYTYELTGTDTLQGRPVYVIQYTPKEKLEASTRRDKIFNKLTGTVWIDRDQFRVVRAEGRLSDNVWIGLIAANVSVVDISYDQQEIETGIWMPKQIRVKIGASIFFFKKINRNMAVDFYDFEHGETAPPGFYRLQDDQTKPPGSSSSVTKPN